MIIIIIVSCSEIAFIIIRLSCSFLNIKSKLHQQPPRPHLPLFNVFLWHSIVRLTTEVCWPASLDWTFFLVISLQIDQFGNFQRYCQLSTLAIHSTPLEGQTQTNQSASTLAIKSPIRRFPSIDLDSALWNIEFSFCLVFNTRSLGNQPQQWLNSQTSMNFPFY